MRKRPWLYIVFAFVILMTGWTALIWIAVSNTPDKVPVEEGGRGGD